VCVLCGPTATVASESQRMGRRSLLAGVGGLAAAVGLAACSPGSTQAAGASPAPAPAPAGNAKLEVVLLGTQAGPPIEESDRTGISSALVVDGRTYLIDCGRAAVTQFKRSGLRLDSLSNIFITHLHADHISDYYNFFLHGGYTWPDSIKKAVNVYGPGPAGGLPPKFGGGEAPTVAPANPTPGTAELTERCHEAYAYSSNVFIRDSGIPDIRTLVNVHEIPLPNVAASARSWCRTGRCSQRSRSGSTPRTGR
jgi:metallo-beta-lactamase superfamily protein